jgi:membrane-associated phospholipid phosphatase
MLMTPDRGARRFLPHLSLAFCAAALFITFIRLIEFDAPLTRFVRSLNDFQIDYLHNPWLRELSDRGDQVGKGESLLVVSAGLLAGGYLLHRAALKRAGWETLLAHVAAGVINTLLKHLVGRARPKFMHSDQSNFLPFGGSGWDSFPSGHAMAACAVATVLAVRFPRLRWLMGLIALAVSMSRLFRGSHFLTDIVAGAVFGVLIGAIVAHPWKDRRTAFTSALLTVTPPLAGLLAVMSTIGQSPLEARTAMILGQGGLFLAMAAIVAYFGSKLRPGLLPPLSKTAALGFMGLGIAVSSGSFWVSTVIVLVWLGHWLRPEHRVEGADSLPAWPSEAAFGLGVLLTLLTMMELRGALPIG